MHNIPKNKTRNEMMQRNNIQHKSEQQILCGDRQFDFSKITLSRDESPSSAIKFSNWDSNNRAIIPQVNISECTDIRRSINVFQKAKIETTRSEVHQSIDFKSYLRKGSRNAPSSYFETHKNSSSVVSPDK